MTRHLTYDPGNDPRPYSALSPEEQAIRAGQTTPLRNLQIQSGEPAAILAQGNQQAGAVAGSTPSSQFSSILMQLLQRHQQLGTKPFAEQQFNAQDEQTRRIFQTPSELIGASPRLQAQARGAAAGALDPTIQGARQGQQTQGEKIKSIGDVITTARNFIKDQEAADNLRRDDARALINSSLTLVGGGAFDASDPAEVSQLEKLAGLPKGYIQGITKTLKERELELKKQNAARTGGLSAAQVNQTVNQIRGAFDNEPIVREYNTVLGQIQFARGASSSPTDDISRIYVFAKVMDPNSVVREGEYKTVQDYSTALLQRYGLNAKRVFANTGFLTDEARKFLLNTLERKLTVSASQYNNVAKEYQRQIDDARAGKPPTITQYTVPGFQKQNQVSEQDVVDTVKAHYKEYTHGTREQLVQRLISFGADKDVAARYVYQYIP